MMQQQTLIGDPVHYAGTVFACDLHAKWAEFFDLHGLRWTYEFDEGEGVAFHLPLLFTHNGASAFVHSVTPTSDQVARYVDDRGDLLALLLVGYPSAAQFPLYVPAGMGLENPLAHARQVVFEVVRRSSRVFSEPIVELTFVESEAA